MSFLPKDYSLPESSSSFFKFQDGENRIRILSDARIGFEGWKNSKPFRREEMVCSIKPEEVDIDEKYSKKPKINLFWAFKIWDYTDKQIKIASITQKTVLRAIEALANDEDWGDPLQYDIAITKSKVGERTTYAVSPKPAKKLAKEIEDALKDSDMSLDSLFGDKTVEDAEADEAFNNL